MADRTRQRLSPSSILTELDLFLMFAGPGCFWIILRGISRRSVIVFSGARLQSTEKEPSMSVKVEEQSIRITHLWIYPLKSASPIAVDKALLDAWGLQHDRVFMLVEEDKKTWGSFKSMSQKRYPKVGLGASALTRWSLF